MEEQITGLLIFLSMISMPTIYGFARACPLQYTDSASAQALDAWLKPSPARARFRVAPQRARHGSCVLPRAVSGRRPGDGLRRGGVREALRAGNSHEVRRGHRPPLRRPRDVLAAHAAGVPAVSRGGASQRLHPQFKEAIVRLYKRTPQRNTRVSERQQRSERYAAIQDAMRVVARHLVKELQHQGWAPKGIYAQQTV